MNKQKIIVFLMFLFFISLSAATAVLAKPNYNVYKPETYVQNNVVTQSKSDVIELVMDYSGSMDRWINTAKSAMQSIIPQIPQTTKVGLRVFGQNTPYNSVSVNSNNLFVNIGGVLKNSLGVLTSTVGANSCEATEQVVSVANVDSSYLISGMNSKSLGGSTPLTLALEKTVYADFAGLDMHSKKKIILVTDGGENCGKDPCSFVKKLTASRKDIQIDVIMLGGSNKLQCLSDSTGGKFYHAGSNADFSNILGVTFETTSQKNTTGSSLNSSQNSQEFHYQYVSD